VLLKVMIGIEGTKLRWRL